MKHQQKMGGRHDPLVGRCWFAVRPEICWPQVSPIPVGVYTAMAFIRAVNALQEAELGLLIAEQKEHQGNRRVPQVVKYAQLLTAANHIANEYQHLREFSVIPAEEPEIPILVFAL